MWNLLDRLLGVLVKSLTMNIPFLTKNQRKKLMGRVALIVAQELNNLKVAKVLTFKEIAALTGLTQNRLSELQQKNVINDKILAGLIGGGMVKVSDILKKIGPLTEQEKTYLQNFYIYENRELRETLLKCRDQKIDPVKVLKAALKK